jgi:ribonuclease BN (tRNA processing enzyme)
MIWSKACFEIDDVRITTRYLNHPALTLGYRIEADGAYVVYSTDHEPHSRALAAGEGQIGGHDERHAEFLRGADLVLHDAQYTAKEYPAKIGWGHSPAEYAVRIAQHAGVAKIGLTHHDPHARRQIPRSARRKSARDAAERADPHSKCSPPPRGSRSKR